MLGTLGIVVTGAVLYAWRARRALHIQQSFFTNWPLSVRPLVNTEECEVWRWMCKTFPAHQVNIKIPVTRFTLPLEREQAESLYKLLNGVYCTFTVCSPDGRVAGCADVMGANGPPGNNRQLKQALLAKCGIGYCVLNPTGLPTTAGIRSYFLNETVPAKPAKQTRPREERYRELEAALLAESRQKLSTALNRQRTIRDSGFSTLTPDSDGDKGQSMRPVWQRNSFLVPLEGRASS